MFNSLQKIKDKGVSVTAKIAVGIYLKAYGDVQELSLDSKKKTLFFAIKLKGENDVLEVVIRDYRVTKHGEQDVLIAGNIETSREWLNTVAEMYANQRNIPIPSELAMALHVLS